MLTDSKAFSSFAVSDLDSARTFYEETLGVRTSIVSEDIGLMTLHLAGGRDTMIYAKDDHVPATYTVLNFPVEDVDATVDALVARGVRFEHYDGFDQDEKGIARGPGPAIAWFEDPSGNVLSVLEQ